MLSRWTSFLTYDGEKEWGNRDEEFRDEFKSKDELLKACNKGWDCLLDTNKDMSEENLEQIIYIRNKRHAVTEAINSQMMHYVYHVGQTVFLGKLILGNEWECLSIPKGQSRTYTKDKFEQLKGQRHFKDDL